jgi:pseudouridine-5'-phosphate glycosidase
LHEEALASALELVRAQGVTSKEVTPVLLAEFARFSGGLSVQVNRDLVVANARIAGEVARAMGR